jgi:multiple sugar transport system substrate-binding protein
VAGISRRGLFKLSGAGLMEARFGGLAAILASGGGPAYAQATTVHWLRGSSFVPASDVLLKGEITRECQKALGIKLTVETINPNDIQARITSSIQSGSGPDIVNVVNNWAHLYSESLAEVDDVAEELGNSQGGFYETSRLAAYDGKRWLAVPFNITGIQIAYRKSWFTDAGYAKFPETWERYREAGKKLKAKGRPIGQTLGHTFADAPNFFYPYLWSWGGKEVEPDGNTIVLNSRETVEAVKFMVAFWKDAHEEGGLAWDDTSNNRAFLAGTICATNNGASIYIEALRKPDAYQTEAGGPIKDDIQHAPLPAGPAGQFSFHTPSSNIFLRYSNNQKPAKEFMRWMSSKPIFEKYFVTQQGFSVGPTTDWEKHPLWDKDSVMLPFRSAARTGRLMGYAGPSSRQAAEVLSKHIIVDMFAKAVQGMPAEDAVKWAEAECRKAYA